MKEIISGTVIQRSFIGREAANIIHVASVPVSELGLTDNDPKIIIANVLGIPASNVLYGEDYHRVIEFLCEFPEDYFFQHWGPRTLTNFDRTYDSLSRRGGQKRIFADFLAAAGNTSPLVGEFQLWPLIADPDIFDQAKLNKDVFNVAVHCMTSGSALSRQYEQFIEEVCSYDIPMGQSPKVKAENLSKLLTKCERICVAPLAFGGPQAISHLANGKYVAAMLTAGTAGVVTLILISTISVGGLIVEKVAQARGKR